MWGIGYCRGNLARLFFVVARFIRDGEEDGGSVNVRSGSKKQGKRVLLYDLLQMCKTTWSRMRESQLRWGKGFVSHQAEWVMRKINGLMVWLVLLTA